MTTEFRGFQPARTKRTRTVMGLLVAGLLSATALTASSTFMPPPAPAIAQTLATPAFPPVSTSFPKTTPSANSLNSFPSSRKERPVRNRRAHKAARKAQAF